MTNRLKFPRESVISPLLAVAANLLMVYVVYTLCRLEYLCINWSYFSQTREEGHILNLFLAGWRFDTPGIFYTNALYVLMMLIPIHLKERAGWYRACKWVFILINSIALLINLADSVYFSYTLHRTAWSIFEEFGNEDNSTKIVTLELSRHWYLLLFAALIIWGMWRLYVSPAMEIGKQEKKRYYLIAVLSFVAAGVTTVAGIRGGFLNHWYLYLIAFPLLYIGWRLRRDNDSGRRMGIALIASGVLLICLAPIGGWRHRDIRPIAISNANAFTNRPIETALVLNTPFTLLRSIGNVPFVNPNYFADEDEMSAIYSPLHIPADTILPRKKNICIIIIESFGKEYIGGMNKEILGSDYKGYTPFTDSLLNHSAWWRHSLDNGRKSVDGMPSILAGIPYFVRPFILTPQAVNNIKGIPALLAEKGYSTAFFHGARTGSLGFDGFAKSIGFQKYYGREDFCKDSRFKGDKEFDGYWAIWDEPFLKWYALKMTEMKQPFMTSVFTASNHHPFHVPACYEGKFPEGTMKIHPTVGYTDNALREFFAVAKVQPWYKNTIFVITNDHTNMRDHDEYRSDIGSFFGPIIIFDPSGEIPPGQRDAIAQQTDIMPTLVNYIGYDQPYVAFGCDLFSTPAQSTWAVNYINGVYQYVKWGKVLQFDGKKVIGLYDISDYKLKHNLLGRRENEKQIRQMTIELKAIIQQYMERMLTDRLTAE